MRNLVVSFMNVVGSQAKQIDDLTKEKPELKMESIAHKANYPKMIKLLTNMMCFLWLI
ncbi:MAG: hypothetical protein AAF573_13835 [Bacteroidota bacterium]